MNWPSDLKAEEADLRWFDEVELNDLAIIVVAFNSAADIAACLQSIQAHAGSLRLEVVVVDVGPDDGTEQIVAGFAGVRYMRCQNRGFAFANNRALKTCDARYVLFLNPDTEILQGSLSDLVSRMDARPGVGLAGARQVDGEGRLDLTIRRFPNALRALGDSLSAERLPRRPRWLGERELDLGVYDREVECDWTSGSFMLVRREAIDSAGFMDERFFMYSEETDFCRRIKQAGWMVHHLPWMTILHYGAKSGVNPRIESASAHSRMLYAAKHFASIHRALYFVAVLLGFALRYACARRGERGTCRRAASAAAMKTLLRLSPPPHSPWSPIAVHPWQPSTARTPVRTS
jgi:GT2 family glycosyltransferase